MGNQPNLVKVLLAAGADVNAPDEDSLTPLHVAARLIIIFSLQIFFIHPYAVHEYV